MFPLQTMARFLKEVGHLAADFRQGDAAGQILGQLGGHLVGVVAVEIAIVMAGMHHPMDIVLGGMANQAQQFSRPQSGQTVSMVDQGAVGFVGFGMFGHGDAPWGMNSL